MKYHRRAPAAAGIIFWLIALYHVPAWGGESWAWMTAAVIQATEAVQAAAADNQFFYAISSTEIAKYDRQTGQLVARSHGGAKHLNSGFFWERRLYCAHSNFPRTPEQSEIKVLDPQSMQLETFKDFGNSEGSLTWVLRRGQHWWCNFAYYKSENARTYLAQFDDQWQEIGRWKYPPELVSEWKNYSASGGIWHEGDLLVTGHDRRIVYRLRLPHKRGDTLELVSRTRAPFTGQGIADDPKTGGLVGIDRTKQQILLASLRKVSPLRLRVLSYNIHHGEGTDGKFDLERIARVIRSTEADLVALQEVDQKVPRSSAVEQAAELGRLTQMHAIFAGNIKIEGGDYGNALLSRFPIRRHQNHALPRIDNGEQRGVLDAMIELPDGQTQLRVLATHLDHRKDPQERIASAKAINRLMAESRHQPALLVGDLNAVPDSEPMQAFAETWARANEEVLPTFPAGKPQRQIDYVLLRPQNRWKVIEMKVIDEPVASDHRPLLAVLELLPAAE